MHRSNVSTRLWSLMLSLLALGSYAAPAAAGCRSCDQYFRCVPTNGGAVLCVEGPATCIMSLQCFGGHGRLPDSPAEDLTTWSLFDAAAVGGRLAPSLRAGTGALSLGEDARLPGLRGAGALADAALAYGREYDVTLADATGDGFALKRTIEGDRVRLEVRAVRGEIPMEVLASEALGERDELSVPVRVDGRDRVLVLHAGAPRGALLPFEIARLRRGLAAASRVLPRRSEPLLRVIGR